MPLLIVNVSYHFLKRIRNAKTIKKKIVKNIFLLIYTRICKLYSYLFEIMTLLGKKLSLHFLWCMPCKSSILCIVALILFLDFYALNKYALRLIFMQELYAIFVILIFSSFIHSIKVVFLKSVCGILVFHVKGIFHAFLT